MAQSFRGQVVVITGGSSGIGFGTAQAFAKEGARLVLGARRREELEEAAASLRRGGREARAIPCDVTVPQQCRRLVGAALERWDRIDVLVANAGIGLTGEFADNAREDLRQVFDVNVHGVINTVQAALPSMIERGEGTIVLVSSVLGYRGIPRFAGYCATKFAINGLAESLATELAPRGIHVMLACPGLTDTPFFERRLGEAGPEPLRERGYAMDAGAVGTAIVRGVKRRKRRIVLTSGGRLLASVSRHAPRLADRAMAFWHRRSAPAE